MTRIPSTKTVVSYAYSIKANGVVIGTLQGFSPSANRDLQRIREIKNELIDTVEIVPGRTDYTLSIDKLETYDTTLMKALGYTNFTTLHEMTDPIDIVEEISGPNGARRVISYNKCWIQSVSKTVREGTVTVSEQVTVFPTSVSVIA